MNLKMKSTIFALAVSFFAQSLQASPWFSETLYDKYSQSFTIDKVIYEKKTDFQDLTIFENDMFGKVLTLDGVVQLTEKDEFVYHEMLTHVPIISHGNVKKVLIIGGGDGGIAREVLKHENIERVVLVDIDRFVIELSEKHLPQLSDGAFDNEKLEVIIDDGSEFVKKTEEKFDVIICDSTDPIGPSLVLFTKEFYQNCHDILTEGGIFVTQGGVPFMQADELKSSYQFRKEIFTDAGVYIGVIPTYVGGFMAFGWSTDNPYLRDVSFEEIKKYMKSFSSKLKYYTPSVHKASFALPQFIQDHLDAVDSSR